MKVNFDFTDNFESRHLGSSEAQVQDMLKTIGVDSVQQLIEETVPANIRLKEELKLPKAVAEYEFLAKFKKLASNNKVNKSYLGLGYYNTIVPEVIKRNVLENPGWYTAYTPYQAEIAQGRLEALVNYQTMVANLTGMELSNASLLDESTAAAEAMTMLFNQRKGKKKGASKFLVSAQCLPQTIDVLRTRALPLEIELVIETLSDNPEDNKELLADDFFGVLLQYPDANGEIKDYRKFTQLAKENGLFVAVAADLMSLVLLTPPGEWGADVVVGTTQRFGVPMGYGGPHAGYFATLDKFKRAIPGRIIGVSKDAEGNPAYRMALQTREQHIRREKATSNICTSQVLLAVIAGMYAVYHGAEGLKVIATRIHSLAAYLSNELEGIGYEQENVHFFDTLKIKVTHKELLRQIALNEEINLRYFEDDYVGLAIDETTSKADIKCVLNVFRKAISLEAIELEGDKDVADVILPALVRTSSFLTHESFNKYHVEHEMLRYIKRLENKDLSLAHSMIPLGSCTMKLNSSTQMAPVTWSEFGNMHPFAPVDQASGYHEMLKTLNNWLSEVTGFAAVSFQPNSGAQGEYAGLMVIREYHKQRGESHRNIALIPTSAHGTNPASAVMAAMKVVLVQCDEKGNIDVADLKAKSEEYKDSLACLMVTYPSTHGVFEESIIEVCETIHTHGGQVYMDGANMNAQVGLTSPGSIGADVCHLNLHKTFAIPHGGGGPGVGPIGVGAHLVEYLPNHSVVKIRGEKAITAVSGAPWGSAGVLPISYAYMALLGKEGLKKATETAILNANYIKCRLENVYDILYVGTKGRCAHEMIVDFREFKQSIGLEVEDVAKRLMDYGFHAPTVSFPVVGTLMIEPTESESKDELDRFCDALIQIRQEIKDIEDGLADKEDNVLKNSPHSFRVITADEWNRPYSRETAAYPLPYVRDRKFWVSVSRVDNAYGDRNLMCTCPSTEEYA
jgi:glycine dehydrogenase